MTVNSHLGRCLSNERLCYREIIEKLIFFGNYESLKMKSRTANKTNCN